MKNSFFALAAVVAAAGSASGSRLYVNDPNNVEQCVPTKITWNGGEAPYTLDIFSDVTYYETFESIYGNSFTWNTNVPGGSLVTFEVIDAAGTSAQSDKAVVKSSSDSSCLY